MFCPLLVAVPSLSGAQTYQIMSLGWDAKLTLHLLDLMLLVMEDCCGYLRQVTHL